MRIREVPASVIQQIPLIFDKGGASFSSHKKNHVWFGGFLEGMLVAVGKILWVSANTVRLCSLWVRPGLRRMGLGSKMVEFRQQYAFDRGATSVETISSSSIFERNGYDRVATYADGSSLWRRALL